MVDIDLRQQGLQLLKCASIAELSGQVVHPGFEPLLQVGIEFHIGKLLKILLELGTKLVGSHGVAGDSDNRKFPRQELVFSQVIERGNQLAASEIARCPED